jgi:hypothetical protein
MIAVVNSQCEYWKREFNAEVIIKGENFQNVILSIISKGFKPVVQIDKDLDELIFLSKLPKNSLIGWLHSDESLDVPFNKTIAQLDAISLILRPYHLNSGKFKNIYSSLMYVIGNLKHIDSIHECLKMIFWFCRGCGMYLREQKIILMMKKNRKSFYNFPLGYTDVFCKSIVNTFRDKSISSNQSLMSQLFVSRVIPASNLSFVGQIGQIVRLVAIRSAESAPGSTVIRRGQYGAGNYDNESVQANGMEYVQIVLSSKFILCPPGNISGNTFRIHETVIARRVPLVISNPPSDPNFESPVGGVFGGKKNWSWDKIISEISTISATRYDEILKSNLDIFSDQVLSARNEIERFEFGL